MIISKLSERIGGFRGLFYSATSGDKYLQPKVTVLIPNVLLGQRQLCINKFFVIKYFNVTSYDKLNQFR